MKDHYIFPDIRIRFCEWLHQYMVQRENVDEWETIISFFEHSEALAWARNKNNLITDWYDV